ncbi:hypothetical protein AUJ17_04235 [Candidatus Micrarchaeota archaeon CG1_02_47_40]|uniref:CRISPR-associated endodeoxyribonuclease Cas12f2 n=1 Tax=Micrarchaeota archaeon (strain CG1_02_47_40) TaxID=1805247 RepID=CS12F_MICX1|nr:RecName: Full=CRISPR-associated endodeoxyribonuclease Cas12f2; Short=Mi1Cas12f2; AltName: Full=CRISPR-associated endodeoxyribonuclease Cas14b4 [Candidatus Micrarchaeota archaeon CG1_02_47_40]OIO21000.1 MAG: hypothetical protein AUJ17_04235 [Candidatus Micrarchaeota archaeon CG1_02_47_40]QBM01444.1 CRISPR-associated protein Cas14b.4 [uncultured archaeon]
MNMSKTTISVKLKIIDLSSEKKEFLDNYFNEYAKATTFCQLRIRRLLRNTHWLGKKEKSSKKWIFESGICDLCGENKELVNEDRNSGEPAKICKRCYNGRYGNQMIRKLFVSTKKREVQENMDIRRVAKLNNTHYHRIPEEAFDMIKAADTAEKRRKKNVEYDKKRQMEFIEMFNDEKKRAARPKKPNERETRYVHISKLESPSKGYTLNGIKRKIDGMGKKIERAEKGLSRKKIFGYQGNRIKLDSNWVRFDLAESEITIPSLFKEMKLRITGPTNVHSKSGQIYFAEWFERINKQPNNYCYLIRKTSSNGKYEYYLQYTYEAEVEANKEYAGCLGVDIGCSKLAAAVYYDSKNKKAQKPIEIFTNPIKKIKMRREKLIKLLSRVKVRHRRRKLMQLSKTEPIIDYTCHKTARKIVEMANTAKAFISMENLETGIKQKQQARETKKQKFYRNMFLFRKLSKLIEYKALLKGIKIVYVKPDYTSQTCSSCGADKEKTERPSQAIFRCLNPTCRYYQRDINADFNAAVNIAKKALNNTEVVTTLL